MTNGSGAAGYAIPYRVSGSALESKSRTVIVRLRAIPWTRVIVDIMLLAAMLAASSRLFWP